MFSASSTENLNASTSAEARLLLASATPFLDDVQSKQIKSLAQQVNDWHFVTETAVRKFSAPYLYQALSEGASGVAPPDAMKKLSEYTKFTNFRSLKIAAAQIAFHKTCIEPTRARHAYVKGIALSLQFDGNFTSRFCRDIDVLVDKRQFEQVILAAAENDYRVILTTKPLKFVASKDDLKFVTKFPSDVGLISPDGVLIEVHRRLDKKDFIFNVEDALSSAVPVTLSGVTMQTLQPSLHFTYVCYHHSRHLWSHLHWLADLDLMLRSGRLNKKSIQASADTVGLAPTTAASIELNSLVSRSEKWHEANEKSDLACDFLQACLMNLNGGKELEYELRSGSFGHDLMSKSQISPDRLKSTRHTVWRSKFHPVLQQYLKRPLPAAFFWLYRVQRAIVVARDSLTAVLFSRNQARGNKLSHQDKDRMGNEEETH